MEYISARYSRACVANKESTEEMFLVKLSLEKFYGHRVTWLTGTEYLCSK